MKLINDIQKPEVSFWITIIIPLIGVGISWGVNSARLENLESRFDYFGGRYETHVKDNTQSFENQNVVLLNIQVRLAEIQKDILYIRDKVK